MESIYILIAIACIFVAIAVKFFFWAVETGQYDDLDTEAERILFDDSINQNRTHAQQEAIANHDTDTNISVKKLNS